MSKPVTSGRVYGGGQPIPFVATTPTTTSSTSGRTNPTPITTNASPTNAQRKSSTHAQKYVGLSSTNSDERADFSSASTQTPYTGFGSSKSGTPIDSTYGTNSRSGASGGGSWNIARAVGGAFMYPIHAVTGTSSSSTPVIPAQTPAGIIAAALYDPHLSNFPLLPRFRGGDESTRGRLYPIPFSADSPQKHRLKHQHHTAASIQAQEVKGQQNLSSLLNGPAFAADEVEPQPLYITPLPPQFNESVASIRALMKEYEEASAMRGEYLVFTSHHGTWQKPLDPYASDSSMKNAEKQAMEQYNKCLKVVPERYFAADFSVAQEALMFYEAQLAAAAAEAEEEDAAEATRQDTARSNGNQLLTPPNGGMVKSPSSSSASSFYSTFSNTPSSRNSVTAQSGAAVTSNNSTYFQAAWAATHAPTQSKYSPETIGIVPGVVGAVLVTPAKAAASLYALFNKVTGGPVKSPTTKVVTSHQRTLGLTKKHHGHSTGGWTSANGSPQPVSAEELNALQLQQRLASYLDLVELTLMQLVGSKSTSFFTSLDTIQLLNSEVLDALSLVARIRENMKLLQSRLVEGGLKVMKQQRALKNALELQSILDILASISKTQATIKHLLSTSEFHSAIHLIHSTMSLIKSPQFKGLKCLNQMELKLKENLKLIDMLMMTEFNAIAIPDTVVPSVNDSSLPPITTLEGKLAIRTAVALSDDDRERLTALSQALYSFGTILPTLLKYSTELKEHVNEQLNEFWKEQLTILQPTPTSNEPARKYSASASPALSPAQSLSASISHPNLASVVVAPPVSSSTSTTTTSSSTSSFMSSLIPNALKRTGSVATSNSTTGPLPPSTSPPVTSSSSSSSTSLTDGLNKTMTTGSGFDFSGMGSAATAPNTNSTLPSPSPQPAGPAPPAPDPNVLDSASQSLIASLSHAQFLQLQARLHARICRIVYRAQHVRDIVLNAVASASPSAGTAHSVTITRLRQEFHDLFKSLLAQPSRTNASDDTGNGIVETRCVACLEPRLQVHTRLDLYELKEVFESTMDFVREMEDIGGSGGGDDKASTTKFVCLELRKVTLQHEKSFLSSIHSKLVNELTSAMERDNWERVDVPRPYQILIDSGFTRRPYALRTIGATASRSTSSPIWSRSTKGNEENGETVEESATAATYVFIEEESNAANGTNGATTPSFAKYPITSSVLTLLNLLSFYCECSIQLKGVASDVLKNLIHLLTLFTSRSMQLILGAGAVQMNPDVKIITSKHLALTSQCLTFLQTQLPIIRTLLQEYFPAKHHPQLTKDFARIQNDYQDHVKELFLKLESMAMDVCEGMCKGSVAWIKKEEEIAIASQTKSASSTPASTTPATTTSVAPTLTNDLPTLFKLSNRLLTQTEALYNIIGEFVQPAQKYQLILKIRNGYVERFLKYFHSNSGVISTSLSSNTTRVKLSKRMEVILEKFRGWLNPTDFNEMKQQLAILLIETNTTPTEIKSTKSDGQMSAPIRLITPPVTSSSMEATTNGSTTTAASASPSSHVTASSHEELP